MFGEKRKGWDVGEVCMLAVPKYVRAADALGKDRDGEKVGKNNRALLIDFFLRLGLTV